MTPGDQLILEIKLLKKLKDIYKFDAKARVEHDLVCSAVVTTTGKIEEN